MIITVIVVVVVVIVIFIASLALSHFFFVSDAAVADRDRVAKLGAGGLPGSLGLASVAEEGPGVASHKEIGSVDLGVAVPAQARLVRLAIGPGLDLAQLALLHVSFSFTL
jgi:hypothetical protein